MVKSRKTSNLNKIPDLNRAYVTGLACNCRQACGYTRQFPCKSVFLQRLNVQHCSYTNRGVTLCNGTASNSGTKLRPRRTEERTIIGRQLAVSLCYSWQFLVQLSSPQSRETICMKKMPSVTAQYCCPQLSRQKQIAHGNVNNDRNQKYFGKL